MEPTFDVMKTKMNRLANSLHAIDCPSRNADPWESLTESKKILIFSEYFFYSSLNLLTQIICTKMLFLFWSSGHGQQVVPSLASAASPPTSKPQQQNGSSGVGKTATQGYMLIIRVRLLSNVLKFNLGQKGVFRMPFLTKNKSNSYCKVCDWKND